MEIADTTRMLNIKFEALNNTFFGYARYRRVAVDTYNLKTIMHKNGFTSNIRRMENSR